MRRFGITIFIALVFFLSSTQSTYAITNAELIQQLLAQIQVLQAELEKLTGKTTASSSSCVFTKLLYFSVRGDDVLCQQNYLKSKGYFVEIPNGRYGPYTLDAV